MNRLKREGRRVILDDDAVKLINILLKELKGGHCKVTSSQLVSEIVDIFCRKYLRREKTNLEKIFFDQRKFLKTTLESTKTGADLSETIKNVLKKMRNPSSERKSWH